ncbi:MAG: hypothetical protein HQM02_11105 [Magnetococcales bacterium]|nr:hypothetical protein [Magnetococcales bacterium]
MLPPKKSGFSGPKRVLDWFYEPEESPEASWMKQWQEAWRPIADQSPPSGAQVLVTDGKRLTIGHVDTQGKWNTQEGLQALTHWLPLPMPPAPVVQQGSGSIFRHNKVWRKY